MTTETKTTPPHRIVGDGGGQAICTRCGHWTPWGAIRRMNGCKCPCHVNGIVELIEHEQAPESRPRAEPESEPEPERPDIKREITSQLGLRQREQAKDDDTEIKVCHKCGHDRPRSQFQRRRKNRDGLDTQCRQCRAEQRQRWASNQSSRG